MPEKVYVLDTNVLMYAGKKALTSFEENEVVIPFVVIEELEKKRMEDGLPGIMARHALREIDSLRDSGKLKEGVVVNSHGGKLRVEMNHRDASKLPERLQSDRSTDVSILTVANNLYVEEKGNDKPRDVILVTNDVPLRIKADSVLDMRIEPFRLEGNAYPGFSTIDVSHETIEALYHARRENQLIPVTPELKKEMDGAKNYAFNLRSWNSKGSTLALVSNGTMKLADMNINVLGKVSGKSQEQKAALNYLMNPDMEIVSLGGPAGTGKSLLSLVAGISQVESPSTARYRKVVMIRPMYSVGGQDIGFLPGDADDKMEPWRKAVYDSVEGLVDAKTLERLSSDGMVDVIPATFLRGRTFHDTYVIVDEAQNFEASVLLTILSRIGQGSKIVFLWDASQRDNGKLGYGDGITSVIDKLKVHDMFAHVSLVKSERSKIAEIAGGILEDYLG